MFLRLREAKVPSFGGDLGEVFAFASLRFAFGKTPAKLAGFLLTQGSGVQDKLRQDQAEADAVVAGGQSDAATGRNATAAGEAEPAAAAEHADRACSWACRIGLRPRSVTPIPIATPFPHVAAHVENTQLVGGFLPYGMRC
jgi:hypothetical protein